MTHGQYDRTILVIGERRRFVEYVRNYFPEHRFGTIPACARTVIFAGIRFVHAYLPKEVRGYRPDETTYTYVGPFYEKVDSVLYECLAYESEPLERSIGCQEFHFIKKEENTGGTLPPEKSSTPLVERYTREGAEI